MKDRKDKNKNIDNNNLEDGKKNDLNLSSCECEDCEKIIEGLKEENVDLEGKFKRALADYQNLLKKSSEQKVEFFKYSLEKFLLEILPVYDNLKMAINTLDEKEQNSPWVDGIKYVIKQFSEIFRDNGVEEIKTVGEKFDYNKMEAVKGDSDIVKKELRSGYILNNKVIIPAKVVLFPKEDKTTEENK